MMKGPKLIRPGAENGPSGEMDIMLVLETSQNTTMEPLPLPNDEQKSRDGRKHHLKWLGRAPRICGFEGPKLILF